MTEDPDIPILKTASCPSLTDRSTLTYEIGTNPSGIHFRIATNSGKGIFTSVWVPLGDILNLLKDCDEPFSWKALEPMFKGRSVNNAGFLMAALKSEGLVGPSKEQPRRYERIDPKTFMSEMEMLQSSDTTKPTKKGATPKVAKKEVTQVVTEDNSNQP